LPLIEFGQTLILALAATQDEDAASIAQNCG